MVVATGGCYCHWQVEARVAAKHPAIHRTAPMTKKYPAPNVSDAQVGKPSIHSSWLRAALLKTTFPSLPCCR